jgi:hypothetical protein
MKVPGMIITWINYLLERDNEPIQFTEIEVSDDGRSYASGTVKKLGISVPVEIRFTARVIDPGRLLCEDIELSSSSKVADITIGWLRDSILKQIKSDVLPFGIIMDIEDRKI